MATIPVGGIVSGLDTSSLIAKLLEVEQRPITLFQTQQARLQGVTSAYTELNTRLLALKFKAQAIGDSATFFPRSVTSSAETVASASAVPGTATGTYSLTVGGLAKGSIAAAGTTVSATSSTIASGDGSFQFKLGATGAVQSVAVSATTTLADLVSGINNLNAGVRATIVNTGSAETPAYKLTLASATMGAASNIVIVDDPTTLAVTNTQTATDATFSITGLGSFTRATNTFSDVIDGVTITLKASSGSTDLVVDYDKGGLQTRAQNLVDAYNGLVGAIDAQSAVSTSSDGTTTKGIFTGDSLPRSLRRSLSLIVQDRVSGAFQNLAAVGITAQRDGSLALDASRFQDALTSDPQAVSDLFAGLSGNGTGGIADRIAAVADRATTALTGTIAVRQDGLSQSIKSLQSQIDATQARILAHQDQLQKQFSSLEQVLSKLQTTGNFLTAQFKSLNASSSD